MHCCHTLQLLPCVFIDLFTTIKNRVIHHALSVFAAVVIATSVSFAGESGGGVDQKEAATGLYVLFHRIHYSCRETQRSVVNKT